MNRGWINTRLGATLFVICSVLVVILYAGSIREIVRHNDLEDSTWSFLIEGVGWLIFLAPCILLAQCLEEIHENIRHLERRLDERNRE